MESANSAAEMIRWLNMDIREKLNPVENESKDHTEARICNIARDFIDKMDGLKKNPDEITKLNENMSAEFNKNRFNATTVDTLAKINELMKQSNSHIALECRDLISTLGPPPSKESFPFGNLPKEIKEQTLSLLPRNTLRDVEKTSKTDDAKQTASSITKEIVSKNKYMTCDEAIKHYKADSTLMTCDEAFERYKDSKPEAIVVNINGDDSLKKLFEFPNLQYLSIEIGEGKVKDIATLNDLIKKMENLQIFEFKLDGEVVSRLIKYNEEKLDITNDAQQTFLTLDNNILNNYVKLNIIPNLRKMINIREIDASGTKSFDEVILNEILRFPHLEKIHVSRTFDPEIRKILSEHGITLIETP
jgi:hypothetical protein